MEDQVTVSPPPRLRLRYYLFEIRVPAAFLGWAERDIASAGWLAREVARLLAVFAVMSAITGRFDVTRSGVIVVLVGIAAIVAARAPLRRIALAYQRYGWDWENARNVGPPSLRLALALVFSVVFVLLAR